MNNDTYENVLFDNLLPEYFRNNEVITNIQKESYEHFIHHRLQSIIEEEPMLDVALEKNGRVCITFSQVYVDKPYIVDEKRQIKFITPNEARLRELTYSSAVSVDIHIEEYSNNELISEKYLPKMSIARIPMMIGTSKCNLYDSDMEERYALGECQYDTGGYFIIKGKERVLICQERGNLNQVYVFQHKATSKFKYSAEIRSTSEENGHSIMIQMRLYPQTHQITMVLPFFNQEIPLGYIFIIFGLSIDDVKKLFDQMIMSKENHNVNVMLKRLIRSMEIISSFDNVVKELSNCITQSIIKESRNSYVLQVLNNDIFPHLGVMSSHGEKNIFMMYMLNKLLQTFVGLRPEDDRDHLNNKRFETSGYLISELFRALYKRFVRMIEPQIQKKHDVCTIINRTSIITQGLKTCFATGNWGIPKSNYIRCGVSQILSRLSYNATISHLRRVLIPIGKEGKNSKIRQIHCSQYGFVCCSECFDPNTPILMSDGSIKLAKYIVVGDWLIDDDGNPTRVRKTVSGVTQMYEIKPQDPSFLPHTVTWNHILTLKVTSHRVFIHTNDGKYGVQYFDDDQLSFHVKEFCSEKEANDFMTTIPKNDIIDVTIDTYNSLSDDVRKHLVLFKRTKKEVDDPESFFTIHKKNVGQFVGWQIENEKGRFLLSDGTVSHNTPEGHSSGIVKNFTLFSKVSTRFDSSHIQNLIEDYFEPFISKSFNEHSVYILLNGRIIGRVMDVEPNEFVNQFRIMRYNKVIPQSITIAYDELLRSIYIYSDDGRILRPLWNIRDFKWEDISKEMDKMNWNELCDKNMIVFVDSLEIENSLIAMRPEKITSDHDYMEIHPTFMFGICVNLIPYVDHIQAPRITYQCLGIHETVLMADGSRKEIKDVQVGDKVITFDLKTKRTSPTKVIHQYVRPSATKVYKITTVSGRSITATSNHNFMSSQGWVSVDTLLYENRQLGFLLEPKDVSRKCRDTLIIHERMVREKMYHFGELFIQNFMSHYSHLLPLTQSYHSLYNFSQMSGIILSNKLNLDQSITTLNDYYLSMMMYVLDAYNMLIPVWIMKSSLFVKREFLSAFLGGMSCSIKIFEHHPLFKIMLKDFSYEFMEQMCELLNEFDIRFDWADGCILIDPDDDNIIHTFETIGFRFNNGKNVSLGVYVEYLKYKKYIGMCCVSFHDWRLLVTYQEQCLFVPVYLVQELPSQLISDITVESDNHSFIAGLDSFLSSNSAMGKQAIGMYATTNDVRCDTVVHCLQIPEKPIVQTHLSEYLNYDQLPSGNNLIVAVACYGGYNQEDSVIFNQSSIDRGVFRCFTYRTIMVEEKKRNNNSHEIIELPNLMIRNNLYNYDKLDERGIVSVGTFVGPNDVIVGRSVSTQKKGICQKIDNSLVIRNGEEGYVDRIFESITPDGYLMIKVKIRYFRIPEIGDKTASRSAQKGTIGMIFRQEDMPFTSEGIVPDIIINPNCLPSRMTINQLLECIAAKSAVVEGHYVYSTPFSKYSHNIVDELTSKLHNSGFQRNGNEVMYNGITGEMFKSQIFIGPTYYQRLKHLVASKIHARDHGSVQSLVRQPLEGRSKEGGLRFGEMEKDAMISHGVSKFLNERLFDLSDRFQILVCKNCGFIPNNENRCYNCDSTQIHLMNLPYACKLLFQELMAMNIKINFKLKDGEGGSAPVRTPRLCKN